jgi:hypothetical protein
MFEYLVAKGLLFGVNNDTVFKPSIAGKQLKDWDNKPLQDFLNHYGEQGWEMINIFSPRAGDGFCVVFKRSKN